jgi:aryl-alcohol dehydrogenase-like predicted oxidoreductase
MPVSQREGEQMQTRLLGASGTVAGAVGLGCMGMDWAYAPDDSSDSPAAVIRKALDLGANLLDTADMYGPFTNEETVGKAIAGIRDQVVLATKGGNIVLDSARFRLAQDGSPAHLRRACDASLRRLGTDHIDLYYLHRPDPAVPIEDSVGALASLAREGKVKMIGLSEVDLPTLQRAHAEHPVTALQSELSLWTPEPLAEIVPWCQANGVSFVAFSPLGRGFLTGALRSLGELGQGDFRRILPRFGDGALQANLAIVTRIERVAARLGASPAQVALAWVLAQGPHVMAIPGTRRVARVAENCAAADLQLSQQDLEALAALPAPVGTRY